MRPEPSGRTSGVLRCCKAMAGGQREPPAAPCELSSAGTGPATSFRGFSPQNGPHFLPSSRWWPWSAAATPGRGGRGGSLFNEGRAQPPLPKVPPKPLALDPSCPSPPNPTAGPPRPGPAGVSSIAIPPREEGAAGGGGCHWPGSGGRSCRTQLIMLMARGADVLASPRSLSPFLAGRAGGAALARSHDIVFAPLS